MNKSWLKAGAALVAAVVFGLGYGLATHRFSVATVFLVGAGVTVGVTIRLLARTAMSLVGEPRAEEFAVATGRRRKELEREKQALLKAIKELSFDHEMRKVSDEDFAEIGGRYRARAVRIMRQLEETIDFHAQLERDLAARRAETENAGGTGTGASS